MNLNNSSVNFINLLVQEIINGFIAGLGVEQ